MVSMLGWRTPFVWSIKFNGSTWTEELNESNIDGEILDLIINEFSDLNKQLRKVVFIGLTMKMKRYVKKRSAHTNFLIICMDDLEKAKEWLVKK